MEKKLIFGFVTLLLGVATFSQLALLKANAETPLSSPITYFEPSVEGQNQSNANENNDNNTNTSNNQNTNTLNITVENTSSSEQKTEPTPYVCTDSKPGSAPTFVSASQTGANSITLFWNEGLDPVTHYAIVYGTHSNESEFGIINTGNNATGYTIDNLIAGQTYYFRVYPINGCMPGDYSNELSQTALGQSVDDNTDTVLGDYDSQEQASYDEDPVDYPTVDLTGEDDSWAWLWHNRIFGSIGAFFSGIFNFLSGK
ncbi:MAG: fibronectin type III domain-containing protein [Candidatus Levybacteria bacterium]|nr:fibronectin type III domain-containing protein [Candidatus Levybacteria bacterium]